MSTGLVVEIMLQLIPSLQLQWQRSCSFMISALQHWYVTD